MFMYPGKCAQPSEVFIRHDKCTHPAEEAVSHNETCKEYVTASILFFWSGLVYLFIIPQDIQ